MFCVDVTARPGLCFVEKRHSIKIHSVNSFVVFGHLFHVDHILREVLR